MKAEEFWNSDFYTISAYHKAHEQQQLDIDSHNYNLGLYFYSALSTVLDKSFNGNKATTEYLDKPLLYIGLNKDIQPKEKTQEDIERELAEKVMRRKINKQNYDAFMRQQKGNR